MKKKNMENKACFNGDRALAGLNGATRTPWRFCWKSRLNLWRGSSVLGEAGIPSTSNPRSNRSISTSSLDLLQIYLYFQLTQYSDRFHDVKIAKIKYLLQQ